MPALVAFLRDTLTPRLVAFIAGVTETRATRPWAEGEREVGSNEREQRLRAAAHVTRLITETFDASPVRHGRRAGTPCSTTAPPPGFSDPTRTDATERTTVLGSARRFVVQ